MRDRKKSFDYYIFPSWSRENRFTVLLSSFIAMAGGLGGCFLSHQNSPSGTFVWHLGLVATVVYFIYFFKGKYQRYLDAAWDVYY